MSLRPSRPIAPVPVLELDDGSCLWETNAIRRFLEEQHPEPALYGSGLHERAEINQWTDWVFTHGLLAVMEAFSQPARRGFATTR